MVHVFSNVEVVLETITACIIRMEEPRRIETLIQSVFVSVVKVERETL